MTIVSLVAYVGLAAIILTTLIIYLQKGYKNILMSFLQNFAGCLFIFSGFVKAVDPLGTAYKLEQYFDEFEYLFEGTWFSFLSGFFPWLAEYSVSLSVIMIVFEIVLGVMLILGHKPKFTAWAFFLLVVFFSILTGFTFLTGYVPPDVGFFDFSSWGPYVKSNMKVTDCGCFGDFLVLDPKVSFMKDLVLLLPSIYFIWKYKDMHQLFSTRWRNIITIATTVLFLLYCWNNYKWNIPGIDFRPFNEGKNVRARKMNEEEAQANVQITHYKLENKKDKSIKVLEYNEYLENYKTYKEDWKAIEQIKTEPTVKKTKISDFEITDMDGNDVTEDYLNDPDAHFMIVSYKLKGSPEEKTRTNIDTVYSYVDTTGLYNRTIDSSSVNVKTDIVESTETYIHNNWDGSFIDNWKTKVSRLITEAQGARVKSQAIIGGAGNETIEQLKKDIAQPYLVVYTADDILLKTIIRSNPGVVLWKDGKILDKWHIRKLPSFAEIKTKHGL